MADGVEFSFDAIDNISNVVKQIQKSVDRLGDSVQDLADIFEDAASQQQKYGKAAKDTERDLKQGAKAAADFNKEIGNEAAVKGSTRNLKGYVQTVNDLRAALGKGGPMPQNLFPDTKAAAVEIEKLEGELLGLVNTYRTAFGREELLEQTFTTDGAIAELGQLQQKIIDLSTAATSGGGLDFNLESGTQASQNLREVENVLNDIRADSTRPLISDLVLSRFDELRDKANQSTDRIEEIRRELADIGPAARGGSEEAIQRFGQLSQELQEVQRGAEDAGKQLRIAVNAFGQRTAGTNRALGSLGFDPITLEDIFPTREQQRIKQVQQNIQRAVTESVREGAVKNALNTFLRTDLRLESIDQNVVQLTSHLPRMRYALYDVSNTTAMFGAALLGAVGASVKFNIEFERAFADVIRTTGVAGDAADGLKDELIGLSQSIPVGFDELAGIATLAGQLNIAEDRVASFTETVAKFAATSDVTIDAAATAFGRLDQLVAGVNGQFERLGSAISAVGVNAVATESEIINISTQIASIANIAGFSAAELVGFSSALASVGTRPELARGTFTRLFTEIGQAVAGTKDTLDDFSRLAGQSAEQFTEAWGEGRGADQVVAILQGLQQEGTEAEAVLRQIGITSVRDVPTLLKLAQGVEQVKDQLEISKIGFLENTELQRQYSAIASTTAEKLAVLKNNFDALLNTLGSVAGPFSFVIDIAIKFIAALNDLLQNPINQFIVGFISVLTALVGIGSLTISAMARFGASLSGAGTAAIELTETVGLLRVSIGDLAAATGTASSATDRNTGSTVANSNSVKNWVAQNRAKQVAQTKNVVSTKQETVATVSSTAANNSKSFSLAALRTRLNAASVGVANFTARLRSGAAAAVAGARATRLYGAAVAGLKFAGVTAAIMIAMRAIEMISKQFGLFGEEVEDTEEKIEDFDAVISAIQKDTEDYAKANDEARKSFTTFSASVSDGNVQLSDYAKLAAVSIGESELLAKSIDSTTEALDRQTFAIGENAREQIKLNLAQAISERAQREPSVLGFDSATRAGAPSVPLPIAIGSRLGIFPEIEAAATQAEALNALIETTIRPELSARLSQFGFNFATFAELVANGSVEAAEAMANNLGPAAERLRDQLQSEDTERFAEQIEILNAIISGDAGSILSEYTGLQRDYVEQAREAVFTNALLNDSFSETAEGVDVLNERFNEIVDGVFGPIRAQRELEESLESLGEAFFNEGAAVAANSREMERAIEAIWAASEGAEDGVYNMAGFFNSILENTDATGDDLESLMQVLDTLFNDFIQKRIAALRADAEAKRGILAAGGIQPAREGSIVKEIREAERQIASLESAANNIERAAGKATLEFDSLGDGFKSAGREAKDTASSTRDIADSAKKAAKEIRTLLDYASDLDKVVSRAFDLRFSAALQVDAVTASWESFRNEVEDAQESVEDLQRSQRELSADRAIKEYFLSVAEAYDDQLRAAKLREEIAELDAKAAKNQKQLTEQGFVGDFDTGTADQFRLGDDSAVARRNRAALTGLVSEYQDYITKLAQSGASQDELRKASERSRKEFIAQATALGFAEKDVLEYAEAFDDLVFAIDNIPRNVTIEANVNPALTALRELQSQQETNIQKAKELNAAMNQPTPKPSSSGSSNNTDTDRNSALRGQLAEAEQRKQNAINGIIQANQEVARLNSAIQNAGSIAQAVALDAQRQQWFSRRVNFVNARDNAQRDIDRISSRFYTGGFTGSGGRLEPAGIVHRGEYVVPKNMVNQSTGTPKPEFLAQMQAMQGYFMGGFVGGGGASFPDTMMVELSPYDRQLLEQAGNVQLRLDGRVVAQAANRNSVLAAQRGSN